MSDELPTPAGIRVGAYTGPADEGYDRHRWQIETAGIVTLRREDVYALMAAFSQSMFDRPHPDSLREREKLRRLAELEQRHR